MLGLLMLLSPDAPILLFRDEGVNGEPVPPGVGVFRNILQITQFACFRFSFLFCFLFKLGQKSHK